MIGGDSNISHMVYTLYDSYQMTRSRFYPQELEVKIYPSLYKIDHILDLVLPLSV